MRAALVRAGVVENVADVEDGYEPPRGFVVVALEEGSEVAPGWHLDVDGDFEVPPPPAGDPLEELRALVAAQASAQAVQQESIDWLADVVTNLATGGEGSPA